MVEGAGELVAEAIAAPGLAPSSMKVTLYTDSFLVRGTLRTRQRRLSDVLNESTASFIVLEDVTFEEFGTRAITERASYAQINLATVIFGVADEAVEATPELRLPKLRQQALINVPPFRVTGHIHLAAGEDLRIGLEELSGRFVPVTEAAFWSERINEPRATAPMVAVNHARAHILAPHEERDVWAMPAAGETAEPGPSGPGEGLAEGQGGADPWRDLPGPAGERP